MRLNKSRLKKIVENWGDSEDEFLENEDDDDDLDYIPTVNRIRNKKRKENTPKKKSVKTKRTKKVSSKNLKCKTKKKNKEKPFWYSGYAKSFPVNEKEFLGDVTLPDDIMSLETPYEFFKYFFNEDVSNLIITESNRYCSQNWPEKRLQLSKTELDQFIGICSLMSVIQMSNTRRYWAPITGNALIKETMPVNKFEQIKQQLHFNDNENMVPKGDVNHDRIYKIRPLVNALIKRFQTVPLEKNLSVDEQLCSTKCKSIIKQYLPNKPHKWGFKLHVLAGSHSGFCYTFEIFTGCENDARFRLANEMDLGSSANIVIRLLRIVPDFQHYIVCFDNYFSTLPLIGQLSKRGIHAVGTMRRKRLHNAKLPEDKVIMSLGRGSSFEMVTEIDKTEMVCVTWRDTKVVNLISNFVGANPLQSVDRFDKKLSKKITVDCPSIVKQYNSYMGGVDYLDSMIGRNKIKMRSKKWYMRIYYHLLDLTTTNAWILYKRVNFHRGTHRKHLLSLADFRLKLGVTLCRVNHVARKIGRPPTELERQISLKRKHHSCSPIPPKETRMDKTDHWPMWFDNRVQCKKPKCKGLTSVRCSKCHLALCCNKQRNCFHEFHNC
ncbi:piggyBac transposable element-derived protein 2-like [Bradysia coprophila]|uniref:piggyBac transposable element-derived protein 2-like n=1 Tax=Bradysia coprophila TaxID=38358 RepID=UPI00187DD656|nr:piggyBac transposable element-derived protein 2-like [Bradysia coprophila]